jgi:preprotein translocase subunit SecB
MRKIHYVNSYFPTLSIEANDIGEERANVQCDFNVRAQARKSDEDDTYVILLSVQEKSEKTPYKFDVLSVGTFEVSYEGENDSREHEEMEVAFNGAQILYGQIREQIASMTSRSVYGTLFVPSYYFSGKDFFSGDEEE